MEHKIIIKGYENVNDMIIKEAVHKFETPFYLYEEKEIAAAIQLLTGTIPEAAQLFYSLKANPNPEIVRFMQRHKIAAEVSSIGEIKIALDAEIKPDNIIFSGPGKRKDELRFAVENNLFCINTESLDEIMMINKISMERNVITNVAIRVNPSLNLSKTAIKMTGIPSQFGIDDDSLDETIENAKNLKNIKVIGIQLYNGTQLLKAEDILSNAKTCIEYSKNICSKHALDFSYINFGGGFGVPYFNGEQELDCINLNINLQQLFRENYQFLRNKRCVFESGRFLTANAGVFVTQVLYKKVSHSNTFLICDGGSNFHANSAFLGRRVRNNFPVKLLMGKPDESVEPVTVVGPLCTPTDVIAQDVILPKCVPGDCIIIEKSGAYGLTNSPLLFISHPRPREIFFGNNEWKVM